jgi:uncharacterized glyoxalase superfamily protein PhnB
MVFKDLMPNLMVKDVEKTVDFYKNVLISFQEEKSIKEEYPQLNKLPEGGAFTLYIHVSDVNELYESIKGKATIAKELHKTFYGSTDFAVEDCNGYILTFSQQT